MWSEIKVQFKQNLPNNLRAAIEEHFGGSADIRQAMKNTSFDGFDEFIEKVNFASIDNNRVFLVFNEDVKTLKFHVENISSKDNINNLKVNIDETFNLIKSFSKSKKLKIKYAKSHIYSESNHIITGVYHNRLEFFKKSLDEDVAVKVYIPIATFLFSYMMDFDIQKSLFNVVVAIGATLLWLIYKTVFLSIELKFTSTL